jgi:hypothetical protein
VHAWSFWPTWYGPLKTGQEHLTIPAWPVLKHGAVMHPAYGAFEQLVRPSPFSGMQSKLKVE